MPKGSTNSTRPTGCQESEDLTSYSASVAQIPSALRPAAHVSQASVPSHAKWEEKKRSFMYFITITILSLLLWGYLCHPEPGSRAIGKHWCNEHILQVVICQRNPNRINCIWNELSVRQWVKINTAPNLFDLQCNVWLWLVLGQTEWNPLGFHRWIQCTWLRVWTGEVLEMLVRKREL